MKVMSRSATCHLECNVVGLSKIEFGYFNIIRTLQYPCIESVCSFLCYCWQFILTPGPAEELPVKVPPLVAAIRSNRYVHVKELYIWDIPMKHEDIATLVCNVLIYCS